jgi:stage II sporulation protein D
VAPAQAPAAQNKLGAAVAPLRLVSHRQPILVGDHRYFGTVEVGSLSSGLTVSDRLSLESYLLGLNEVPTDWPFEALRAQAVAARTYALHTIGEGRTGEAAAYGYDICATTACQVFSGADVVQTSSGARWSEAVRSTSGQAVLYHGAPILARYHSTSGGRTIDNEDAFPGEPAYPYLKSVLSTSEEASPLYRWRVTFKVREVEAMLRRSGLWSTSEHLVEARTVAGSPFYNPNVAFDGDGGARLVKTADEFRDVARDLAPAMFPGRYPSQWPTSSGVLPETLPSERYLVMTKGRKIIFDGRGWGHGVGMSQWGAFGMADQGASYTDILGHYYTGVSVGTVDEPRSIEVGLSQGNASVTASGDFSIVDGRGEVLVKRALGSWTFSSAGSGAVSISPPTGYGLPLEVGIVKAPRRVLVGASTFLTVALSRPAHVKTKTADTPTGYQDPGVSIKEAGRRRVTWLAPLEPGRYEVTVSARAGPRARNSEPIEIEVRYGAPVRDGVDRRLPGDSAPIPWTVVGIAAGGLLLLLAVAGRSLARRNPPGSGGFDR